MNTPDPRQPRYSQVLVSSRLGGGEMLALSIAEHLNRREPGSCELLVPSRGATIAHAAASGLAHRAYDLEGVSSHGRFESLGANLAAWRALGGLRRRLVHVHSPYVYAALRPLLMASRHATVLHLHLDYSEEDLDWAFRRPPDLVVLCAAFLRERVEALLARRRARDTRVVVVSNAVDTTRFATRTRIAARAALGLPAERPLLLMAANLSPHKGQETAIRALHRLRARGLDPLLWLVGEEREPNGYTARLQALVSSLQLEAQVRFLGYRSDVPELLAASDALLLPSRQEGLPLVVLEAQAAGVPVLAAPTAGVPEVVEHAQTGFLIEAGDDEGYASALDALLTDETLARRVAQTALARVRSDFGLDRYGERIVAAYGLLEGVPR